MARSISSSAPVEHCLLLIPNTSDASIYGCFRELACRWRTVVRSERMVVEGDVPLRPAFREAQAPAFVQKMIDADAGVLVRLDLDIAGLQVAYVRSAGPIPYRQSLFDELRLELASASTLHDHEIEEVFTELCVALRVSAVSGTRRFTDVAQRTFSHLPHERAPIIRNHDSLGGSQS